MSGALPIVKSGLSWTLDDLLEWARTTRYFTPDDFEKLAMLADRAEALREYVHGLGGWLDDDPAGGAAR